MTGGRRESRPAGSDAVEGSVARLERLLELISAGPRLAPVIPIDWLRHRNAHPRPSFEEMMAIVERRERKRR